MLVCRLTIAQLQVLMLAPQQPAPLSKLNDGAPWGGWGSLWPVGTIRG